PLPDSLLADAPYRAGRAPDPRLTPRLNAYFHRYGAADTLLVYPLNAPPVVAYRYLVVKCAAGRTQGWVATRFAPLTRPSLPDEPGPWGGF
ncbi:MAG: hypothetical protein M3Y54_16415, partial [Bacteroidota bacterium]|nr:hypothetical protein [Bacteroidota bacterium]